MRIDNNINNNNNRKRNRKNRNINDDDNTHASFHLLQTCWEYSPLCSFALTSTGGPRDPGTPSTTRQRPSSAVRASSPPRVGSCLTSFFFFAFREHVMLLSFKHTYGTWERVRVACWCWILIHRVCKNFLSYLSLSFFLFILPSSLFPVFVVGVVKKKYRYFKVVPSCTRVEKKRYTWSVAWYCFFLSFVIGEATPAHS